MDEGVSIPYRLATNTPQFFIIDDIGRVSIPYRLATNNAERDAQLGIIKFQFLIGWLQTWYWTAKGVPSRWEFQFLIGWLQTIYLANMNGPLNIVSIPYRLATNQRR